MQGPLSCEATLEHPCTVNEAVSVTGSMTGSGTPTSPGLMLCALDAEDLATLSTHMHQALMSPAQMVWIPKRHRFAMVAERLDWLASRDGQWLRRPAGLHFDHVMKVERSGFADDDPVLNLIGISFASSSAPSGLVHLHFADGQTIRLHVECLEVCLRDLGDPALSTTAPTSLRPVQKDRFSL